MDNQGIIADKETEIIIPPPTALDPIPAVSVALRLDNKEQLLSLLESDPHSIGSPAAFSAFRQVLVFGSASLRTLLLRQVLSNPYSRTFKGKKKNWDEKDYYPLPNSLNIVATRLLQDERWEDDADEKIDVITYFLSPADLSQVQLAAQHIRSFKKAFRIHHRLVFLPQPTAIVNKMIKNLGLASAPNVSTLRLQMDIYPLETDVFSMEYDLAFREVSVESTPSSFITSFARGLLKLQDVCGKIPRIQAYGPLGEEVVRKLLNLTVDEYLSEKDRPVQNSGHSMGGDVTALIVIDRKVDLVTPMISPLTYEGLLDDVVGIDCGFITVDVDRINPEDDEDTPADGKAKPKKGEKVCLGVNGSDSLYAEVRNQHVEKFGSFLQDQAKALRESHANFTNKGMKKNLSEIHQFVKNIPVFTQNLRSLTNHIHLAELVKNSTLEPTFRERWQMERSILEGETCYDLLDDLVASQYSAYRFLRLFCLQSLCSGGIKSSRFDSLRRDVIQTYGYEYLFVLENLERAGLLRRREGLWLDTASPFNSLRKSLILINAEVDTVEPDDISYVSSGYAPLSVRLVQTAMKGWSGRDEILREIPGRVLDVEQRSPPEDMATSLKRLPSKTLGALADEQSVEGTRRKKPVLMVAFVGGVTFTELAALRFLSKRPSFPYHIMCLTTKVLNGHTFLESLS